jgi:hypothetical protein
LPRPRERRRRRGRRCDDGEVIANSEQWKKTGEVAGARNWRVGFFSKEDGSRREERVMDCPTLQRIERVMIKPRRTFGERLGSARRGWLNIVRRNGWSLEVEQNGRREYLLFISPASVYFDV